MPQIFETRRDNLLISSDPARLDLAAITDMLSRTYWAKGRTDQAIGRAIEHSLAFGVYENERQIGLARIISDYTTFAYVCDVVIHEQYRGQGIGKWLIETVRAHPDLQGLRRWMLATRDAHGLYRQYGFKPLGNVERWMEIVEPPNSGNRS